MSSEISMASKATRAPLGAVRPSAIEDLERLSLGFWAYAMIVRMSMVVVRMSMVALNEGMGEQMHTM